MVRIITDSTADLGPELAQRYNVFTVPLLVHHNQRTYHDGVDLDQRQLFELVAASGQLPKTAAPPVAELAEAFEGDDEIVFISLSSQLSGTWQVARLAAEATADGRVHVVDSLNLSTGIGLLVLLAAELRDQGLSAAAIERELLQAVPRVRTSFLIDTLQYLYMGGRCTALQSIMGSLLKLRPIIAVQPDGTLAVKDKVRGSRQRALETLMQDLREHLPQVDRRRIFVTHTTSSEDAALLAEEIDQLAHPEQVLITEAGSVIASHCGPRTIGILYMLQG